MSNADDKRPKMYLVPCSCGRTFAVSENYDHQGNCLEPVSDVPKLRQTTRP